MKERCKESQVNTGRQGETGNGEGAEKGRGPPKRKKKEILSRWKGKRKVKRESVQNKGQ